MSEDGERMIWRDELVDGLRRSMSSVRHGLGGVPPFIVNVVAHDAWRDRIVRETGERATFSSFAAFVAAPPLEGLGATVEQLRGLCRDDPGALDAIDQATQNAPSLHRAAVDVINGSEPRPTGTSSAAALRRLRKDRPDLHARVVAGQMKPHAAMIEAGFRQKTATVVPTVEGFARSIKRQGFSEQELADLGRLIGEDVEGWPL